MMKIGDTYDFPFRFTQEQVIDFARVTGDDNPIHLDADYAANTLFKKPIVHGFLAGSIFSRVFGTMWPGAGSIYLQQSMQFKRPVFVDTDYTAKFEVIEADERRNSVIITTTIVNDAGKEMVTGEALLKLRI